MKTFKQFIIEQEIKPYRIPKYKEKLNSFGYMEDRSEFNKSQNTTEHADDNGNWLALHHTSTYWSHVDNKGKETEGRGMNKLLQHLLHLHNN